MSERFALSPIPRDPVAINAAMDAIQNNLLPAKRAFKRGDPDFSRTRAAAALDGLRLLDQMGSTRDYRVAEMALNLGDEPFIRDALEVTLSEAERTGDHQTVLNYVRLGEVLGLTRAPDPVKGLKRFLPRRVSGLDMASIAERTQEAEAAAQRFQRLFEGHTAELENKRIAAERAAIAAAEAARIAAAQAEVARIAAEEEAARKAEELKLQGEARSPQAPESPIGKTKEWTDAQNFAIGRWRQFLTVYEASQGVTLEKPLDPFQVVDVFTAAMDILHDSIFEEEMTVEGTRAVLEVLVPRFWPPADLTFLFERLLHEVDYDPDTSEPIIRVRGEKKLAQLIFLPTKLRPATLGQDVDVTIRNSEEAKADAAIRRRLGLALHSDRGISENADRSVWNLVDRFGKESNIFHRFL